MSKLVCRCVIIQLSKQASEWVSEWATERASVVDDPHDDGGGDCDDNDDGHGGGGGDGGDEEGNEDDNQRRVTSQTVVYVCTWPVGRFVGGKVVLFSFYLCTHTYSAYSVDNHLPFLNQNGTLHTHTHNSNNVWWEVEERQGAMHYCSFTILLKNVVLGEVEKEKWHSKA